MHVHDIAVVGSGIGGSLCALSQSHKDVIVFEKDINVGGCASTFTRMKERFNAGATTFVGYEDGHPVKKIFDKAGFVPDIQKSDIAIRIICKRGVFDRVKDVDTFVDNLQKVFPHPNNANFWKTLASLDKKFWQIQNLTYLKNGPTEWIKTFASLLKLSSVFGFDIFSSAERFITTMLPNISCEYRAFIDAQLLITVQSNSKNLPLLGLVLGLCYPFHDVYYPRGGMGKLIEDMLKSTKLHTQTPIIQLDKHKNYFVLRSKEKEFLAKNVVLNGTIYDNASLFNKQDAIFKYYNGFQTSYQSAFVVYLKIDSLCTFEHHYQVLLDETIPNTVSQSYFVSFSDKDDTILSKGGYSVTISTHTHSRWWNKNDKHVYKEKKLQTQEYIVNDFLKQFPTLRREDISIIFSATSQTFKRYIGRENCGGKALSFKSLLQAPSVTTPFGGLYQVGDTLFNGQGWPGIAIGVDLLGRVLDESRV